MPPAVKISAEMIVDAAFALVRESGADTMNARSIAKKLGCSTQPILYHFKTVGEIRAAVYQKADAFHTGYITDSGGRYESPMLGLGMRYIKFAREEKNLFRFLFQTDSLPHAGLDEIIAAAGRPLLGILAEEMGASAEAACKSFLALFLPVHGYASMLANNSMKYDEGLIADVLGRIFRSCAADSEPSKQDGGL